MKVLWFTNTPSLAAAHLRIPITGGGWIVSLEERLQTCKDIELAVAFCHGDSTLDKFKTGSGTYYAIPDTGPRFRKLLNRHLNIVDDRELLAHCGEIIRDFKPDIIHVFGTEKAFGLITELTDIPVLIHLQGIMTLYEKKWFAAGIRKFDLYRHANLGGLLRGNSLAHHYGRFRKAAARERTIFGSGRSFMGRTDWDRRITAVLAPEAKYYHGDEILRSEFYQYQWNKQSRPEKIFISTVQPNIYKGFETILETAMLLQKIDRFPFSWYVAGIGPSDKLVQLFEQKLGLRYKDLHIVLMGGLSTGDLIEAELNADVFLHPSHIDNSPNSVCEAMLLGMPVIATQTGGTSSLLKDKEEGILVQDGDPYAMAGAILELTEDFAQAARLGKNARQRALERHDPGKIVCGLLDTYAELIQNHA